MKEITKYVCEHCKREYMKKENAEKHESICWKNKATKSCLTCIFNGGIDSAEILEGHSYNDYRHIDYIVCTNDTCEGSDDMKPITNCEHWKLDSRTKKEKHKEITERYVNRINTTIGIF